MESRLFSQDSQILECETALRIRTEELNLSRAERLELEERFKEMEREFEDAKEGIVTLMVTLQDTQDELQSSRLDLRASEAIIKAQVSTERSLNLQGQDLQTEVLTHREDILALLAKITRLG
jgi:ribosome-associated translation inhibitor RaiA